MDMKKWIQDNAIKIIIALVALNFMVMGWGAVTWGVIGSRRDGIQLKPKKTILQEQLRADPNLQLTCAEEDLSGAVASVRPAVVNIIAERVDTARRGKTVSYVAFDDPAIQFTQEQPLGSGVIVDPRGYILTNNHVIANASNVKVTVFGFEKRVYQADIVRKDNDNDLAILKIHPESRLPTAILGDSDMIKVADTVLAIGSPYGLEQTVTAGIISDDERNLVIDGQTYKRLIQTDAAINRGNSGGPLINTSGEVIGINTAIYAPTGVFAGVGFAIPINRAKGLLSEVLRGQ